MRHVPTLLRRELGAYFLGPMAYLILLAFQAIAAVNFWSLVESLAAPPGEMARADPLTQYVAGSAPFWIALLVAIPALTMRLIAEERRSGTIEGLLTLPVTEAEVVVAKWLAAVVMFWALLLPFALYLPILRYGGRYPFDPGPVASLALGLTTLGMMFSAIGLFFSALTRNQVVAAVGTFVALFGLVLVSALAYQYGADRRAGWAEAARFVAVLFQVQAFGAGVLDPRFAAMHLSVALLLLFLTVKVVQFRRGT